MANPAKYDPSASMVSPPDPAPELTGTVYPMGVSVPVYSTDPPSDPVPITGFPVAVPVPGNVVE
ncbi:hypothetical protein A2U01_0052209, partial [Trifolium medium]|nr:hypothetical protein [Trifolium medium]